MAGIRVLVLWLFMVFGCLSVYAQSNINPLNGDTNHQQLLPAKWKIPEKHFLPLEPIVSELSCLHGQKIKVKYASIKTTMMVRPSVGSLLKSRKNRTYVIRINNNDAFSGVLYHQVPDKARTGLWAHELMHIKDYKGRSVLGVFFRGWQYLSKRGKIRFEREIDQMVIDAGFGEYLWEWSNFVLEESDACPVYKAFKRDIYLKPCEILGNCDLLELEASAAESD